MSRLAAIFLVSLFALEALPAQWNIITHNGRRHVPIEDVATFYRMNQPVRSGQSFTLSSGNRTIKGRAGTREVLINGVKYILCFPIVARDGRILISAMDVTKIIEPVMRPGRIENATQVRTVVLDPGHGGHDSGARGPHGREKDFALDVALRAKSMLERAGYNVVMTRSTDVFIPLERRAAIANRHRDGIFVSIHFNHGRNRAGTGIETFCLAPRGVPSMDKENVTHGDMREYPGHARDPENIALATAMHSSMLGRLRLYDRGIKRARFVVIRDIRIPGVLVEGGFMDHPTDGRLIASAAYRQNMAQAIVDGVANYRRAISGRPVSTPASVLARGTDTTNVAEMRPRGWRFGRRSAAERVTEEMRNERD